MAQSNNRILLKRTTTAGRTPNTTNSGNTQYIAAGELALNLADGILYTSNGSNLLTLTPNVSSYALLSGGLFTGSVNATSYTTGATGAGTGGIVANVTTVFIGNNTINTSISAGAFSVNGAVTANNSGFYPASNTVGTALGSTTQRWVINANTINASGLITGTSGATITGTTNTSTAFQISTTFIANTTGIYHTGTANAASFTVGTSFIANTTQITITGIPISANGGAGTSGQVLTSNGSTGSPYWSTIAGVNTAAQYTFTNTIAFSNTITVSNISANGTTGSSGQVLTSDGTKTYWSTPSGVTVSDTAPSSPSAGNLWYYSVDAQLYIYYNDGDTSQWVSATGGGSSGGVISNANNALYLGGVAANQYAYSNSVVNVAAQYAWTNNHTFTNTITFSSTINGTANNALYLGGVAAASYINTTSIASYAPLAGAAFTGNVSTSANLTVTGISTHTGAATFANTISVTGNATFSNIATFSSTITVTGTATFSNTISDAAGNIRSIPQNSQSATYELTANDNGKHISTTAGVTVNGATLSIGQTFAIFNNSASAITITQGTGVTMYLAGTATTGNRTLAQRGLSTILMVGSNTFVASGSGLT
jgi:hypothetical protein